MIVNSLAGITIAARIEESTLVFLPAITQVKGAGQHVGQVMVRGQVQDMQFTLVFAALPYAIEQEARVLGRKVVSNGRGMVRTQRQGIQQKLIFAIKPLAPINAPQICACGALREEIIAILLIWSILGIMVRHFQ